MAWAAAIGAGASLLSSGVSAAGSAKGAGKQGAAQAQAAMYNAQVARNNATIDNWAADYTGKVGFIQAADQSTKGAVTGAKVKTAQAANGIDVNTGSAVDVQVGQREIGQKDATTVLRDAQLKAYGYRVAANNENSKADLDTMGASADQQAASASAQGSILSGATSILGKFGSLAGSFDFGGTSNADKTTGTIEDATASYM